MQKLSIPESALVGPGVDATPGIGPAAGDQGHPLSVPAPAIVESTPAPERGPSMQKSLYEYPYAGSK